MKTSLILPLLMLVAMVRLQGQDTNGIAIRDTKLSVQLPHGKPHPVCIVRADKKQMQLQDGETFDGSLSWNGALNGINPDWIESVSVFKGESATHQFGPMAQDGVIFITLKKGSFKSLPPYVASRFKKVKRIRS